MRARPAAERVELAFSWNRRAGEIARAGARARARAMTTRRETPLDAARIVEVFGVKVPFADRDDLLAMKRTARRSRDIGDIAP